MRLPIAFQADSLSGSRSRKVPRGGDGLRGAVAQDACDAETAVCRPKHDGLYLALDLLRHLSFAYAWGAT